MKTLFAVASVLLLGWCGVFAGAPGEQRFEIYSTAFTDMDAVEPMVRAIVGDEGNVAVDRNGQRLLVMTTDERHAKIAEVMKRVNIPPRNVRVDVSFDGGGASAQSEASVSADGQVVFEDGLTHGKVRVKPRLINETTTTSRSVQQTLLVASGREGTLRVGEDVPYLEWIMDYGYSHGWIQQRVAWQRTGSSLLVQPTIVGDGPTIRVRITPQLSGLVEGRPMQLRFAELATEVYVQDGQTFHIGGNDQAEEFYSRFLIGRARSGRQETLNISLTPHIIGSSNSP